VANNHINDFGEIGRARTVETLTATGLAFAGLQMHPFDVIVVNGVKYGFCAFSPHQQTWDVTDIALAQALVRVVANMTEIVIVSFHGGAEGDAYRHVPQAWEYFYDEPRGDVHAFAHAVIDAGADVVFGHGPHVTRALELYRNRLIAYSLGNFCTYGLFGLSGAKGIAPLLKVMLTPTGEFIAGEILPIKQESPGGPRYDPERRVIRELQYLTAADFPETLVTIRDDGKIVKSGPLAHRRTFQSTHP